MPKVADVQALFAVVACEPMGHILEMRRAGRRVREKLADVSEMELLQHLPVREKGVACARAMVREFRRKPGDDPSAYNPSMFVYDLIGMLTDADSRAASARRAWGLCFALPVDGDVDRVTGSAFLSAALVRLLTDEAIFAEGRQITVLGDQGAALIEWTGERVSRFRATGPEFNPARAIVRARSIEVPKLRKIFDVLAEAKNGARDAAKVGIEAARDAAKGKTAARRRRQPA
jgi:hypothetical protein